MKTLAMLNQPCEQTVKHVLVNEGELALVEDEFRHHRGGAENAETAKQSHTVGTPCDSATIFGKDKEWSGVPMPSRLGKAAMQDTRRD